VLVKPTHTGFDKANQPGENSRSDSSEVINYQSVAEGVLDKIKTGFYRLRLRKGKLKNIAEIATVFGGRQIHISPRFFLFG
jgi:hypothetical protein